MSFQDKTTDGDELVEFDTYPNVTDAYIAKGILETNGIRCVVNGQLMSTLYSGVPCMDSRLYVRRRDLATARELLKNMQ